MEKRFLAPPGLLLLLAACLLLVSCGEFGASSRVFLGNYSFFRGDYQQANIQYLKARDSGIGSQIVGYNLGTVYQALGEVESAMDQWEAVLPGEDGELAFRKLFSLGILHYQLGEYQPAYDLFRQALIRKPSSLEAKINLEYSFRKLNIKEQVSPSSASDQPQAQPGGEDIQRVLEYIRRTEMQRPPGSDTSARGGGGTDW